MKRSRACDDLVALAAKASEHDNSSGLHGCSVDIETPFMEGLTNRFKRSRASSPCGSSGDETDDHGLLEIHPLQFTLEMDDKRRFDEEVTLSSSAPSRSSMQDEDSLPLRRNSRELMLLRKKKQRIAEITSSFNEFSIHDEDVSATRALHHPTPLLTRPKPAVVMDSPETPEPRILRGLCFSRESRCIDPLDKRQAHSFDISALIMLSVSPKR